MLAHQPAASHVPDGAIAAARLSLGNPAPLMQDRHCAVRQRVACSTRGKALIKHLRRQLTELGIPEPGEAPTQTPPVRILIVDDTKLNVDLLRAILAGLGHELLEASNGESALEIARKMKPQLLILDVVMPGLDGFAVCERLKADPETRDAAVIFCSGFDDVESRVRGFAVGGVDFLTKPFHPAEVVARVATHLAVQQLASALRDRNEALARRLALANAERDDALERVRAPLLGASPAARLLGAAIEQFAATQEPVLLHGPNGAGELAVALAIHAGSKRSGGPFVSVDCSLLEGTSYAGLLGPESGPAHGPSKYSMAEGGTLLLLHVNRLEPDAQRRLRELVGETSCGSPTAACARVLAHSSLQGEVGPLPADFDPELRSWLLQSVLRIPSLAERRQDVPAIAQYVLERQARQVGKPIERIGAATLERLVAYAWPGNVSELEHVIHQAVLGCRSGVLEIDASQLLEGPRLGSYRLREKLGEGGMGEVWRATHELLARPAAVKLIRGKAQRFTPEFAERFRREARATAELRSPHTVTLYDFGVTEANEFYYVMELLEGLDLGRMLIRFGPMPGARVAHLLAQACRSLAEAHAHGLVHRDIKPANLFIARLGLEVDFVKVLDFGMVTRAQETDETGITRTGSLLGTPEYMAPEMALGAENAVTASDIYSLGVSAYQALSGTLPFSGTSAVETLMKHVSEPPRPLDERAGVQAAPELKALVMRCLRKQPEERPTAEVLWNQIEEARLDAAWSPAAAMAWWREHMAPPAAGA